MNKEVNEILIERQSLITLIGYLEHKLSLVDDEDVRELLNKDKTTSENKLEWIENSILENGLPLFKEDTSITFEVVNSEIDRLSTSKELLDWIKLNCNEDHLNYIQKVEKSEKGFNDKMTGKWLGKSISKNGFLPGEFSIGVCQIGNKIFGCGALIGSIYSKVFIKGLIDENEIQVELLSIGEEAKTFFEGEYKPENDTPKVVGNYYVVDGFDEGRIESTITKDIKVPLSEKTQKLILISNLKKQIATCDSNQLIEILDEVEKSFREHQLESIFHKKRINTLSKSRRLQILSFAESQLEESKITNDILNLISQIETGLKGK